MEEYDLINQLMQMGQQQQAVPSPLMVPGQPTVQAPVSVEALVQKKVPVAPVAAYFQQPQPKFPTSATEFSELIKRQTEGLQQQRQSLQGLQQQAQSLMQTPDQTNIAPILAISDFLAGTSYLKDYKTPEQKKKEAQLQSLGFQMNLQKGFNDLTDKEIDLFKAQYQDSFNREKLASEEELARLKIGSDKQKDKKLVTTSETAQLGDLKAQVGSLDDLYADWQDSVGGVSGPLDYTRKNIEAATPNTALSKYKDNLKQKAQLIGKALEGGKLTDVDYEKYVKFLPQVGDTPDRAKERVANLRKELESAYNNKIKSFGEAGYATEGFTAIDGPAQKPAPKMSFEEWKKQRAGK